MVLSVTYMSDKGSVRQPLYLASNLFLGEFKVSRDYFSAQYTQNDRTDVSFLSSHTGLHYSPKPEPVLHFSKAVRGNEGTLLVLI